MAKVLFGPMVAKASGSVGGTVFSHNRYGTYTRRRAQPTISTTSYALEAKARMATASSAWSDLTGPQRIAWATYAANNPITDRIGERQVLTGHACYVGIASSLAASGEAAIDVPPTDDAPIGLTSCSLVADIGAGSFELTFAATPVGADEMLILQAAVVDTASVNYVQNLLRQVTFSTKAQATAWDFQTELEARFGTLQVGNYIHCMLSVFDTLTGLRSQPMRCSVGVTTT